MNALPPEGTSQPHGSTQQALCVHFPFVICSRQNKKEAMMRGVVERYERPLEEETLKAVVEVQKIALFRLKDLIRSDEQEFENILHKL